MRADRLVATLLLLQTRGRTTAADVARELEVSLATARRDLAALAAAGVPVYPQAGRGRGWQLVGGARTDLTGLTAPCEPAGTADDGRARAHVTAPHALDIARHLAGWGGAVEVVEPASVRAELARLGAELVARHGGRGAPPGRDG